MATGTPVLMQKLPGMPEEYCQYVYLYDDSVECLQAAILEIKKMPKKLRQEKGENARTFIIENKNTKMQIAKVINSIM